MARPHKKELFYFNLDVAFYRDIKMRMLLRYSGGPSALGVLIAIFSRIYESGYYLDWNNEQCFTISTDIFSEDRYVAEIVEKCLEYGIFDKKLFEEHHILTSHDIQERYLNATIRRTEKPTKYIYNDLIKKSKIHTETELLHTETELLHTETELLHTETELLHTESTQRKEKKSKDNNSLRSSLSPSTTPSSVCVCEMNNIPMTAREGIEVLKNDREWLLQMQRKFGLDAGSIVRWLESFSVDCDCLGKQDHNSIADIKQHFNAWLSKQKPKRTGGKKGADDDSAPLTSQQRWNKCHAELCQAVSPEECRQSFDVIRFERFEVSTSKLFIQVPNKETYEYMEYHLVDVMSRIIPKYFGANFKLQYHLP